MQQWRSPKHSSRVGSSEAGFYAVGLSAGLPLLKGPKVGCTGQQGRTCRSAANPHFMPDSESLRKGVQIDEWRAPLGYHIQKAHPADGMFTYANEHDGLHRLGPPALPAHVREAARRPAPRHHGAGRVSPSTSRRCTTTRAPNCRPPWRTRSSPCSPSGRFPAVDAPGRVRGTGQGLESGRHQRATELESMREKNVKMADLTQTIAVARWCRRTQPTTSSRR